MQLLQELEDVVPMYYDFVEAILMKSASAYTNRLSHEEVFVDFIGLGFGLMV